MKNSEAKAMTRVAREREVFEATWTRYVNALERYDEAMVMWRTTKNTQRPGHWRRIASGARRAAEQAYAVLSSRFGMDLGGAL